MPMYHEGNRQLQDQFGSTALADRLVDRLHRTQLTDEDRDFIHTLDSFFLATATPEGLPDCSFKGGPPGFVQVIRPDLLVWPDYDGNGMFKSLGNIRSNGHVGLLFIRMGEAPKRLRINGTANIVFDDPLMASFSGAQGLVRVTPTDIFPNCPRYIPDPAGGKASPYVPVDGQTPVEPKWKAMEMFKHVVPPRKA